MADDTPGKPRIDDEYLDSVLIGGREPFRAVIADYDPAWPKRFAQERERIEVALAGRARRIEHIGSTAVPGLAAKPIVDIMVTLDDVEQDCSLVSDLERAGYVLRVREPGHRMFRTPARDVHVHVWNGDDPEVGRHLLLRDWLRRSSDDLARYARTKRDLATRSWSDMNYYAEAKSEVISEILGHASSGTDRDR